MTVGNRLYNTLLLGTSQVPSGDKLDILSGGELEISSGATFDCDADMTMAGNINLADSKAVVWGADSDVSMTHDGTTGLTVAGAVSLASAGKLDILSGAELEISSGATFDVDADMTMAADIDLSASSSLSLGGIDILLGAGVGSAAAAAGATLLGLGTSADPIATAVADKNAVEFRSKSTATSGDHRTIYTRCEIGGAGGAGESLRGNTVVTAAAGGTVNGAHGSVSIGAGGSIAGMASGVRGNFLIPDSAISGGTIYGMLAELYAEGSSSDISGATAHACLGIQAGGDATGKGTVANAIAINGTDGTGEMLYEHTITTPGAAAGSVQCDFNGTTGFLYWWATEGAT